MVPAGTPTQQTVDRLAKLMDRDDAIVDGGNSKWTDDKRRAGELKSKGIHYIDVGTSGGVWGLEVGYCMMVGGPVKAVKRLTPFLDVLAPQTNEQSIAAIGPRGWMHFGPAGAGHFVKMVHNGVEYGLMQAYAEGFDLFDKSEYELDNAKIAHLWGQGSVVRSWLCELAARAFEEEGNELSSIEGYAEDSGEGRWTIEEATARDVPTPAITAALYARLYSRGNGDFTHRVLAALRNQFGGHAVPPRGRPAPAKTSPPTAELRAPRQRTGGSEGTLRCRASFGERCARRRDDGRAGEPAYRRWGLESALPVKAPTTLVIFGATGDLAQRKLLPALYNLAHEGGLPERFHLIGVSRREKAHAEYAEECDQAIRRFSRRTPRRGRALKRLLGAREVNVPGTFDDESASIRHARARLLDGFEENAGGPLNRAFYLSTAPSFFPVIVEALGAQGLNEREGAEVRVVIEKPFGTSLEEARELNRRVLSVFDESQVFRIDHYLGKETVQNMMAFRFANGMFEPLWNRNYIDSVQITAAEDIGIGTRAGYYDDAGALRDLIQNHMLQLLCHVAMEPPVSFTAEEVRNEKVKVLHAIHAPAGDEVGRMSVRGQYGPGHVAGEDVAGYLQEDGVREESTTETYAAMRLEVDNWRWAGVPFYLRAGKRLARKITEIAVTLKPVPHLAFSQAGSLGECGPTS